METNVNNNPQDGNSETFRAFKDHKQQHVATGLPWPQDTNTTKTQTQQRSCRAAPLQQCPGLHQASDGTMPPGTSTPHPLYSPESRRRDRRPGIWCLEVRAPLHSCCLSQRQCLVHRRHTEVNTSGQEYAILLVTPCSKS